MLGGGGTLNEIVHGLTLASEAHTEAPAPPVGQRPLWWRPKPQPMTIPVGIIPEGRQVRGALRLCWATTPFTQSLECMQNVLYAGLDNKTSVDPGSGDVEAIRAMLRIVKMRPLAVPLLQCQADDGQVCSAHSTA